MNYVIFTVKVIKNSGQSFFSDGTSLTELTVQLPQIRKNNSKIILQVSIWGKLSYDVAKYYQPDDYITRRKQKPLFANARSIKNALDRARMRQANRIFDSRGQVLTKKELVNIEADDILQSTVFN